MKSIKIAKGDYIFIVLILLGLLRTIGYVSNSEKLDGLGALTCISPLPTVFSKIMGIEAFSSTFWIEYENDQHQKRSVQITPEIYSKIKGPYNLKSVYAIAIGYSPTLPKKLTKRALHHAFYEQELCKQMGIIERTKHLSLRIRSNARGLEKEWVYDIE